MPALRARCVIPLLSLVASVGLFYVALYTPDIRQPYWAFDSEIFSNTTSQPVRTVTENNEDKQHILSNQQSTASDNAFGNKREIIHSPHPLSQAEVASRFDRRREILRSACRLHSKSSAFRLLRTKNEKLPLHTPIMNVSVTYCPIEKIASTTWKEIFRSIYRKIKAHHMYAPPVNVTHGESHISFTFVREPYGRLLSAYVDKIFSPNTLYWRLTGRYIVKNFRNNPSPLSLQCGHDVTFPEFVRFFIHMQHTGLKRDGHFVPIHDHCQMCRNLYKYIGHLETLKEDMPFILKAIQSPVTYNKKFDNATIAGGSAMALKTMRSGVQRCMDLDEACRRLWKKWQIRGIISKTQSFPLTKEKTRNISREEFQAAAIMALGRSGEKTSRLGQKKEALREAFASVPLADRLEVKKLLLLDFDMFGFNPEPEEVFPKTPVDPLGHFSYFDLNT